VVLAAPAALAETARRLLAEGERVAVLARRDEASGLPAGARPLLLSDSPDEMAHELYAALRRADELGATAVVASLPEERGLGAAILDRLRRAAGPRTQPGAGPGDDDQP
jgi:L-threonylcarbamoyladenylate synthase